MDLRNRISLMQQLGAYMASASPDWLSAKEQAYQHNPWFTPAFIDLAVEQISSRFLQEDLLNQWSETYAFPQRQSRPAKVGLVMAGNIPLVGFHDFLSVFISGHHQVIKLSAKDQQLFPALIRFLATVSPESLPYFQTASLLKGCDAYIATGSNNTARYFDYYFAKYPSLIRRNRTSVGILDGTELSTDLENLADDVHLYFGLGCRNVTKILVPENYDFIPLLEAFRSRYHWQAEHHRYKNNYDYQLSLAILNKQQYMTNDSMLFMQADSVFSPISTLHYSFYRPGTDALQGIPADQLQGIVGRGFIPFGESQQPGLADYADGADTMKFLQNL